MQIGRWLAVGCLVPLFGSTLALGQPSFTFQMIQYPALSSSYQVTWLSADGSRAAGNYWGSDHTWPLCFTYQDGHATILPTNGLSCTVSSGNSKGDLVGTLTSYAWNAQTFTATSLGSYAFVYKGGNLTQLDSLLPTPCAAPNSTATVINEAGDAAGYSYTCEGTVGFVYSGGRVRLLPQLSAKYKSTFVFAINSKDDAAGFSFTDSPQATSPGAVVHAVLLPAGGGVVDLGTLGGPSSRVYAINSSGQATGFATAADGSGGAFFYDGSNMTSIPTNGWGKYMNDRGEVVGIYSINAQQQSIFWSAEGLAADINQLVRDLPTGWLLYDVASIDNQGRILAQGVQLAGVPGPGSPNPEVLATASFLLTPVPTSAQGN